MKKLLFLFASILITSIGSAQDENTLNGVPYDMAINNTPFTELLETHLSLFEISLDQGKLDVGSAGALFNLKDQNNKPQWFGHAMGAEGYTTLIGITYYGDKIGAGSKYYYMLKILIDNGDTEIFTYTNKENRPKTFRRFFADGGNGYGTLTDIELYPSEKGTAGPMRFDFKTFWVKLLTD